jgi:5-methylcytosine-specific restriction endonuclease McrA
MARKDVSCSVRFKVLERDSFTCQYCGRSAPEVVLHVDHINPASKGGANDMSNLITSCRDCNLGKSDTEIDLDNEEKMNDIRERVRNIDRLNIVVAVLETRWCTG